MPGGPAHGGVTPALRCGAQSSLDVGARVPEVPGPRGRQGDAPACILPVGTRQVGFSWFNVRSGEVGFGQVALVRPPPWQQQMHAGMGSPGPASSPLGLVTWSPLFLFKDTFCSKRFSCSRRVRG